MNAIRIAILVSVGFVLSVAISTSCFAQWSEVKTNDKIRFEYQGREYDGQVTKISQFTVQIKYVDKNKKERDLPFPISSIKLVTRNDTAVEQTPSPKQPSSNNDDPFKDDNPFESEPKNPSEPESNSKSKSSSNLKGKNEDPFRDENEAKSPLATKPKNPSEPESNSKSNSLSNLKVGNSIRFKFEGQELDGVVMQITDSTINILYKDEAGEEWSWLFQKSEIVVLNSAPGSKGNSGNTFKDQSKSQDRIAANFKSDSSSKSSSRESNSSKTNQPDSSSSATDGSTARTMTPAEIQEFREKMIPPEFRDPFSRNRSWMPRFRPNLNRLGGGLVALIASYFFIAAGINNVKTRVAEESGRRRLVNDLFGASNTYTGGTAVFIGYGRIIAGGIVGLVGLGMIVFGIF